MDFQSLNQILGYLKIMEPQQQQFLKLMEYWEQVLGVMATRTKPLYIDRVLSQELSFRVPQLLGRLNHLLPRPLENIKFSAAHWHTIDSHKSMQSEKNDWLEHPSMIPQSQKATLEDSTHKNQSPQATFKNWAKAIDTRSQGLPLCPQCQCPTPPGEIQRWSVCAICATKQWSSS